MDFEDFLKEKRAKKSEKIRKKNNELRRQGKPTVKKGWGKMVDTGIAGSKMTGHGAIDLTGQNIGNYNYYGEEQKRIANEVDKNNQ